MNLEIFRQRTFLGQGLSVKPAKSHTLEPYDIRSLKPLDS